MKTIVIGFVENIETDWRLKQAAQSAARENTLIICADGGGEAALAWEIKPDLLIGDMDSINPTTLEILQKQPELEVRRLPVEKDETDLEMGLYAALERGATEITIIGGLGGRLDHTLGNLYLLAAPQLQQTGLKLRILGQREEIFLLRAGEKRAIEGQPGELLSLFPFAGDATGVSTANLYYPLDNETLLFGPTRGISNVFTASSAQISLENGLLLIVHTFKI